MSKILLVEDDNNLREIYEARLMAEGYTIVTAPDGEAALAIASQEKPDLVISDVMMPNISGFDMLDIMRNTNGLKQVHVIMLTALSQAEDQARADALGADRYLVKSQVTLEDIVNNAKVLLGDVEPEVPAPAPEPVLVAQPVAVAAPPVAVAVAPEPVQVAVAPEPVAVAVAPEPVAVQPQPQVQAAQPVAVASEPVVLPQPEPVAAPQPVAAPEPAPVAQPMFVPEPAAQVPVYEPQPAPVEAAPEVAQPFTPEPFTPEPTYAPANPDNVAPVQNSSEADTLANEQAAMQAQIEQFINQPVETPAPEAPAPAAPVAPPVVDTTVINPTAAPQAPASYQPAPQPAAIEPQPVVQPTVAAQPVAEAQPAPTVIAPVPAPQTADEQHDAAMDHAVEQLNAAAANLPAQPVQPTKSAVGGNKVIQPITSQEAKPDINQLLAQEEAREQVPGQGVAPQQPSGPRPEDISL